MLRYGRYPRSRCARCYRLGSRLCWSCDPHVKIATNVNEMPAWGVSGVAGATKVMRSPKTKVTAVANVTEMPEPLNVMVPIGLPFLLIVYVVSAVAVVRL